MQLLQMRTLQYQPQQRPLGLIGMDPRLMGDPRFDVETNITPQGRLKLESGGEGSYSSFNPNTSVKYLADVDDKTLGDDMWAVTAGGHSGTSEGDKSSPWFIENSKSIVGNSQQVTPQMIALLRSLLLRQRYGEIRQTHPGLGGYTPQGLRY
jgi:hypothetical protein